MTLEFRPPTDLINAYLSRPSPGQQASEGINQALQTYAKQKSEQQQQALNQQQKDIEMAKGIASSGQDFTDAYKQIIASRTPTPKVPFSTPPAPTALGASQNPDTVNPQANAPQISSIVKASLAAGHPDHAGIMASAGGTQPPVPSTGTVAGMNPGLPIQTKPADPAAFKPTTDPLVQEYMKDPIAFKKQHGVEGITKLKTQLEIDKGLQDRSKGPLKTITKEQAIANGTFDASKEIMVEPPDKSPRDQKYENEQNRLEGQAIDRMTRLRGDQSLARTENQRDAAIQAYNTMKRVKEEGRLPSQLEYYDILGQMWKARTGASPTDQALRDLDAKTFKGDLGKAYQYFSGKPAGVTTGDVMQNVMDFAADSGLQADKFHASYMDSHKLKPSGLEESRWQPIFNSHRGLSFVDATGYQPKQTVAAHQSYSDPSKEERYQKWKASQRQ